MTTINGSPPGEGYNLPGAERLSPTVRAQLRDLPTRAQIKERLMTLADTADIIRDTLILTARQVRDYAKSDLTDCDLCHDMVSVAEQSNRLELLKLAESELGLCACLHNLFHHLPDMPLQVADSMVLEVLRQFHAFSQLSAHQKELIQRMQERDAFAKSIAAALFGGGR